MSEKKWQQFLDKNAVLDVLNEFQQLFDKQNHKRNFDSVKNMNIFYILKNHKNRMHEPNTTIIFKNRS